MKQLLIIATFAILSFAASAQVRVGYQQILSNVPTYSSGGQSTLVLNATTGRQEKTTTTYLQSKVLATT